MITYTFNTENTYELRVYDVFSDEESVSSGQWVWSADEKGNAILWLYKNEAGETLDEMWEIVQLNGEEMTWQKVGTEYSIGTWGSDYKHFKRSE